MRHRHIKYHAEFPGKTFFSYALLLLLSFIVVIPYSLNTASASPADSKLIKELYESDKALNSAYRRLYRTKTVGARKILKAAQKQWIKARDSGECQTQGLPKERKAWLRAVSQDSEKTRCIINRTHYRIIRLQATLSAKPVYTQKVDDVYPTYPEAWSRELTRKGSGTGPRIYKQDNYDYLIIYPNKVWRENGVRKRLWNTVYFFSGKKRFNLDDRAVSKMTRGMHAKGTYDLTSYKPLTTHKGLTIAISGLDARSPAHCPQDLNAFFYVDSKPYPPGRPSFDPQYDLMKSLFYRLDVPQTISVSHQCTDTGERTVTFRTVAMGATFYDELDDGTILTYISAGQGVVVRLTPKLTSKAKIFGDKLIWVPTSEVKRLFAEADIDSSKTYKYVHDEIFAEFKSIQSVK